MVKKYAETFSKIPLTLILCLILTTGCKLSADANTDAITTTKGDVSTSKSTEDTTVSMPKDSFLENFHKPIELDSASAFKESNEVSQLDSLKDLLATQVKYPDDKTVEIYLNRGISNIKEIKLDVVKSTTKRDFIEHGKQLFDFFKNRERIALYYFTFVKQEDKYGNASANGKVLVKLLLSRDTANKINWETLKNRPEIQDDLFDEIWLDTLK